MATIIESETPDQPTEQDLIRTRIGQLEREVRDCAKDIESSKKPNFRGDVNWASVKQLRAHRQAMLRELYELRLKQSEAHHGVAKDRDLGSMTVDERMSYSHRDAAACELAELEVYVAEWCSKLKLRLEVEDGMPALVRDGLRLVASGE
ncbi:hypothetical protein H8E07_13535 [bacterium]|nr:hypothetical protein [bacterium]